MQIKLKIMKNYYFYKFYPFFTIKYKVNNRLLNSLYKIHYIGLLLKIYLNSKALTLNKKKLKLSIPIFFN